MALIVKGVKPLQRIAGVGVMLAAGYFSREQLKTFGAIQDMSSDAYVEKYNYQRMLNSHGYISDMQTMSKGAGIYRNFMKMGPYGMFYKIRKFANSAGAFLKDFILTPNLGWLAIGGAYMAGINAHKIVTGPAKLIWRSNILQKAGDGIVNFFSNPNNFKWMEKSAEFLFTKKEGLLVTAAALTLGYLFFEHVDRSYQNRVMEPYAQSY